MGKGIVRQLQHRIDLKQQHPCDIHVVPFSIRPSVLNKCFMNQIAAHKSEVLLH